MGDNSRTSIGWIEWIRGLLTVLYDILFQRILACHLKNPLPIPPMNGLTCIVTGCTSGIGLEIARQLAVAGAHVVMACRNAAAANDLIQKWQKEESEICGLLDIEVMELDLLSLESVAKFAYAWNARQGPLHVLINNAGIFSIGAPQKFSKDGFEEHMQVNHFAPALLTILLLPSLLRGSPSRVVNVNSNMHHLGFVDPEDLNITSGKRKYSSVAGYSGSKLAQIMFSSVLQRKIPSEAGINIMCVSPGVVTTNVARDLSPVIQTGYRLIPYFLFTPAEGARSSLFAATDPQVPEYCSFLRNDEWPVCPYFSGECRPANAAVEAHNVDLAAKVTEKTSELVGLPKNAVERLLEGENIPCKYCDFTLKELDYTPHN
eukprot:TRINITY_DN12450_c0_g1_i1.p1 TRINITY_DN12450_c0_g1~~TRINITY_DN12450_c0_g1_i1.p1  ORF type:complete len:375 (+),score=65.99 TRINITY_DN12450_c0_g1_i1:220-1344(+)